MPVAGFGMAWLRDRVQLDRRHLACMDKLTCELCSGDRFDPVYLTDTERTPLLACRQCRLVFLPPARTGA